MYTRYSFSLLFILFLYKNVSCQQWLGPSTSTGTINRSGKVILNSSNWDDHLELSRNGFGGVFKPDHSVGYQGLRLELMGNGSKLYVLGGNVGIGTSNPIQKLDVVGNVSAGEPGSYWQGFRSNAPSRVWGFQQNDQMMVGIGGDVYNRGFSPNAMGIFNGSTTKEDIYLYNQNSGGADFLVLKASGNVGLGTVSPGYKFEVCCGVTNLKSPTHGLPSTGTIGQGTSLFVSNNDNLYGLLGGVLGTGDGWLQVQRVDGHATAYNLYLQPNAGSVGIGTTNTSDVNYRLFVEKGIRTRKVKVDQTTWPDYVFEPTYKLISLQEVEAFIKAHKHLPEVPSAKEVKKNGLDLGENQAVLLKKIEELTLYVIELKKENEQIKAKLDKLTK